MLFNIRLSSPPNFSTQPFPLWLAAQTNVMDEIRSSLFIALRVIWKRKRLIFLNKKDEGWTEDEVYGFEVSTKRGIIKLWLSAAYYQWYTATPSRSAALFPPATSAMSFLCSLHGKYQTWWLYRNEIVKAKKQKLQAEQAHVQRWISLSLFREIQLAVVQHEPAESATSSPSS